MKNQKIVKQAETAVKELISAAKLEAGDLLVIGCSTSEITGSKIGTDSKPEVAGEVFSAIYEIIKENGIYLAAQCCEHLNRALVVDAAVAEKYGFEQVNAIPQYHAGGAFAVTHYNNLSEPVLVESICAKAAAGMDIGGVMIGMHIHPVAVPLRLTNKNIGDAMIIAARHRPKYVGGERAVYDKNLE